MSGPSLDGLLTAMKALFVLPLLLAATPAAAQDLSLGLPINCTPGVTCWVQQYPDHDPSADVKDYACGAQTYDGHDGTDIRIRDMKATAEVLSAAAGTVKAIRDGVADHLVRTEADRTAVTKIECGNGVLIAHVGGWETQYCHLRKGSVAVRPGDRVTGGQRLGLVGSSGMAAFPHVHLAVRKDGKSVDPFRPKGGTSCGGVKETLWKEDALAALPYRRGAILRGGFAPGAVDLPDLESGGGGSLGSGAPDGHWAAMVGYVWVINLENNDEVIVSLDGPGDLHAENKMTLDRPKAQFLLFAGRKRPQGGWPKGQYVAKVEIRNGNTVRISDEWTATID